MSRIEGIVVPRSLAAIDAVNPQLGIEISLDTEHYVTLFDSNFIPQGLSLYYSLVNYGGDFVLWVLCLDDDCFVTLRLLDLPRLRLLKLSDFESPELLVVKATRSRAEYCWTLTPFCIRFVFEVDIFVQRVTYLDADMCFFKSPSPIFRELESSGKSVLITDHAYAAEYDQSAISGQYCVQFLIFVRHEGELVRRWWESRCIEWCRAVYEDGKFGDQKYLESFPRLFPSLVHVLQSIDVLLAPWNAKRFPYSRCIAFHFHSLRIHGRAGSVFLSSGYYLPRPTIDNIYLPYVRLLADVVEHHDIPPPIQSQYRTFVRHCLSCCLATLRRSGRHGAFNRYVAKFV